MSTIDTTCSDLFGCIPVGDLAEPKSAESQSFSDILNAIIVSENINPLVDKQGMADAVKRALFEYTQNANANVKQSHVDPSQDWIECEVARLNQLKQSLDQDELIQKMTEVNEMWEKRIEASNAGEPLKEYVVDPHPKLSGKISLEVENKFNNLSADAMAILKEHVKRNYVDDLVTRLAKESKTNE